MIESSNVYTNIELMEMFGLKIAKLLQGYSPSLIVSGNTPFLNLLSHIAARELHTNRVTVAVDLGVLEIEPAVEVTDVTAFLSTYKEKDMELLAIQHYLLGKSMKLILVQISAEGTPGLIADLVLDVQVVQT